MSDRSDQRYIAEVVTGLTMVIADLVRMLDDRGSLDRAEFVADLEDRAAAGAVTHPVAMGVYESVIGDLRRP